MKFIKTTEQIVSKDYPYGFRLRTTKTDYLEFDKKKGFRHCSFTIDPRNGRVNKPKKSTYNQIMVLGTDETTGYTKCLVLDFYNHSDIDRIIKFFSDQENYNLFTNEQMEYIYMTFLSWIKMNIHSQVVYCASKFEDLKPLYNNAIDLLVKGIKEKGVNNYFSQISFDWVKIDSFKVEGYQPFKTTIHTI